MHYADYDDCVVSLIFSRENSEVFYLGVSLALKFSTIVLVRHDTSPNLQYRRDVLAFKLNLGVPNEFLLSLIQMSRVFELI